MAYSLKKGIILTLWMSGLTCLAGVENVTAPELLDPETRTRYVALAKSWAKSLWTNDLANCDIYAYPERPDEGRPWRKKVVVDLSQNRVTSEFTFCDRNSDVINSMWTHLYRKIPISDSGRPICTTKEQARARAAECAAMFGLSNLWDATKFELRSWDFTQGEWGFDFTPIVNGYPTLYAISVRLADLPGLPLTEWFNGTWEIPTNLPTRVAISSQQAQTKAEEYLKKYFPLRGIVPQMNFVTNRVEYVTPNYNYIRPADASGFSSYVAGKNEVVLAWKNYFKKPQNLSFHLPAIIYVDAVTGDMLGGSD